MTGPRHILHVDMDAFFVSVELRRRPDLAGQPVVVGGTGNRGVVAAASYEARRFGVHSALPSAVARRRCPHAVFLPGDHELYGEVSAQVREIFGRYTPLVEPLSLDEAFLDVTGAIRLFGDGAGDRRADPRRRHRRARPRLLGRRRSEQVPRQAGVGRGQAGGDAASGSSRDRAWSWSSPGASSEFLHPLPVKRLWGVGPETLEKLDRLGVRTVGDLRRRRPTRCSWRRSGQSQADHLLALAVGLDDRPVEPEREPKSIGHEETFATNTTTAVEMRTRTRAAGRRGRVEAARAGVGARTLDAQGPFRHGFHTITRSTTAAEPVDSAETIVALLQPLVESIDPSPGVRLVGVSGSNLAAVHHQLTFDEASAAGPDCGARDGRAGSRSVTDSASDAIGPASALARAEGSANVQVAAGQQWGPDRALTTSAERIT